jgi:hypothetical protein
MTNINGEKRVPLGAIDNFPVTVGTITAPIKVDVTEATSYSVIVGNDWLQQVKADISFGTGNLTIRDGETTVHIPCTFIKDDKTDPIIKPPFQMKPIQPKEPEEEEFSDEEDLDDANGYWHSEAEVTGFQERPIKDIQWGPLDPGDLIYLPRREGAKPDKRGIFINDRLYEWAEIQAQCNTYQAKTKKRQKPFHWHGPGVKCWCYHPLHTPQDMCYNCYGEVATYVTIRTHMTDEQDLFYLGLGNKEGNEPIKSEEPLQPITPHQQQRLDALIKTHEKTFAKDLSELGCAKTVVHRIELKEDKAPRHALNKLHGERAEFLKKEIEKMLKYDIIRPSKSPFGARIVLVGKKTGDWRFYTDSRDLNAITKFDNYPFPRAHDIFNDIGNAKWFSALDLASGYWQVPMDEFDKEKTAFISQFGTFEFN